MEKNFNYAELNEEFQELLERHDDDTEFINPEDEKPWYELCTEDDDEQTKKEVVSRFAVYANAWHILCKNHDGLREVADWSFGATFWAPEYQNLWDVFVDDKDEIDRRMDQD